MLLDTDEQTMIADPRPMMAIWIAAFISVSLMRQGPEGRPGVPHPLPVLHAISPAILMT